MVRAGRFRRGEPQPLVPVFGEVLLQILIQRNVDQIPVIQSAALDRPVGDIEAERPDEMEAGPGGGAGARDGARVVGDLRLDQYDIEHSSPLSRGGCFGKSITSPFNSNIF